MSFREQLKAQREARGLSRAALAELLGVSASAVGNYETGVSFPKEEVLLRLFNALQTEPNRLFCDSFQAPRTELSSPERELLEKYRSLSPIGRDTMRSVAGALCSYRDGLCVGRQPESRRIPLYVSPTAAGYATPVPEEDFTYIAADDSVPRGADFAVRIPDDSMESAIRGGSVVYVNHDPLADGDVGLFCVDGAMLCKQYHRDDRGTIHLFSLNRARADADVTLAPRGGQSLTCCGRVMLAQQPALPQP